MVPLTRRRLLTTAIAGAGAALSGRAHAFGTPSTLDMPLLDYDAPAWNPRPGAVARMLLEIELTTSIQVTDQPQTLRLGTDSLSGWPLLGLCGDRAFPAWSARQRDDLRRFLAAGGLLFVDSSEGRDQGAFFDSVQREIEAILPSAPLQTIPEEHVLFKSFYLVTGSVGRTIVNTRLHGAFVDDRLAVVFCHNDLLGALARDGFGAWQYDVRPGGERQRQMSHRFGVNLAMYALCLDYKEDQVHVPFLLNRRRWRVD
jgi:hypothetical protein